jgi:hypothetical protein
MRTFQYLITVNVNICLLSDPVKQFCDTVNKHMEDFGFDEQMSLRAPYEMSFETPERLTPERMVAIKAAIEKAFAPADGKVTGFVMLEPC